MLRLTLAQMRRSIGRLIAAGIAIALGTGFVCATILGTNALSRATFDAVTAEYADADAIITQGIDWEGEFVWSDLAKVEGTQGVSSTSAPGPYYISLGAQDNPRYQPVVPTANERLATYTIASGQTPVAKDEIALPADAAESLGVTVGDTVPAYLYAGDGGSETTEMLTVTGLSESSGNALLGIGAVAVMSPAGIESSQPSPTWPLTVALDDGVSVDEFSATLANVMPGMSVQSRDAAAEASMAEFSDGQNVFAAFIMAFAALSLIVAGLVISNTFQVLVAQRTRTLALLRCTGASTQQLRRSVLLEGGILGFAASIVGIVLAGGLVQLALTILRRVQDSVPIPAVIQPSVASIIAPIVLGVLVTVVACLVPANQATRVAPLAALRPLDPPSVKRRGGVVRLVFALLFVVAGGLLLVGGIALGEGSVELALLSGVAGGAISFVGVVLGAVFWLPPVARLLGKLVGKFGPAARLATENAVRNPRRIAATASALLIGVTLVTTMSVGAASARATMTNTLNQAFPFDVAVQAFVPSSDDPNAIDEAIPDLADFDESVRENLEIVQRTEDVEAAARALTTSATSLSGATDPASDSLRNATVLAVTPGADAAKVIRGIDGVPVPEAGEAIMSSELAQRIEASRGTPITGDDAIEVGPSATATSLKIRVVSGSFGFILADYGDLEKVRNGPDGPNAVETLIVASLTSTDKAVDVQSKLTDSLTISNWVQSPAAERAMFDQVINTVLAVIVGLLAIAVIIALIGVANTLSLSVLERRRESATLRAIGLSRRQLRGSLAIEGMFIAAVGAVLGIVLGLIYGWVGSSIVLGSFVEPDLMVPWRDFGLVALVALVAGLLASVAPARGALKLSPVAALAVD